MKTMGNNTLTKSISERLIVKCQNLKKNEQTAIGTEFFVLLKLNLNGKTRIFGRDLD